LKFSVELGLGNRINDDSPKGRQEEKFHHEEHEGHKVKPGYLGYPEASLGV
jgi:hypothetical protein